VKVTECVLCGLRALLAERCIKPFGVHKQNCGGSMKRVFWGARCFLLQREQWWQVVMRRRARRLRCARHRNTRTAAAVELCKSTVTQFSSQKRRTPAAALLRTRRTPRARRDAHTRCGVRTRGTVSVRTRPTYRCANFNFLGRPLPPWSIGRAPGAPRHREGLASLREGFASHFRGRDSSMCRYP
jgi:hypothetical protein